MTRRVRFHSVFALGGGVGGVFSSLPTRQDQKLGRKASIVGAFKMPQRGADIIGDRHAVQHCNAAGASRSDTQVQSASSCSAGIEFAGRDSTMIERFRPGR
jgi:hypothetical protein